MSKANSKSPLAAQIFAWCDYANNEEGYAVYRVVAKQNGNGGFVRVDNPGGDFPNRGTIRILRWPLNMGPSRKGNHSIFEYEDDPHYAERQSDAKAIKYRATSVTGGAIQIISLPYTESEADNLGERLKSGVHVLGEHTGRAQVIVELKDGAYVGPFVLKQDADAEIYRADEQSLLALKSGWKSAKSLHILPLQVDYQTQRFVFGELPPGDFAVDVSPTAFALKRALEYLGNLRVLDGQLTRNKARDISLSLAQIRPPDDLKARCDRLVRQLNRYDASSPLADAFLAEVLLTPVAKAKIEAATAEAVKNAKQLLEKELGPIRKQVDEARAELAQLTVKADGKRAALTEAEAKITEAESRYSGLEKGFTEKLHLQFQKAQKDASEILATITMLRPFLGQTAVVQAATVPETASESLPIDWKVQDGPKSLDNARDAHSHLSANLVAVGLNENSASRVATACTAAFAAGQAVSVRGSAANVIAEALACSFLGPRWGEISIPVGYADVIEIGPLRAGGGEGVVLHGANRSCLDAYGSTMLNSFKMGGGKTADRVPRYAILCLCEGPSALAATPQFSEIGPVIHTDALVWADTLRAKSMTPGAFKAPIAVRPGDREEETKLLDAVFSNSPNVSARMAVTSAFPLLIEVIRQRSAKDVGEAQAVAEALSAAVSWWAAPYLHSIGGGREILATLDEKLAQDKLAQTNLQILFREKAVS